MELFRKLILFGIGFLAAASIVIADDRMAGNYGYVSALDISDEIRAFVLAARERLEEPEDERDPELLEAFLTQKI